MIDSNDVRILEVKMADDSVAIDLFYRGEHLGRTRTRAQAEALCNWLVNGVVSAGEVRDFFVRNGAAGKWHLPHGEFPIEAASVSKHALDQVFDELASVLAKKGAAGTFVEQ